MSAELISDLPSTAPTAEPAGLKPHDLAAERQRLKHLRSALLAETAARLLLGQDPDRQVLPALYGALAKERIVDASLGYIVTDVGQPMTLAFAFGVEPEVAERCHRLDFGQAICGTVAARRHPMHVTDIQQSLDPIAELVRSAGIGAYACYPLIVGERLLGTLSFASRSRRAFDSEDLGFFRAVAKQVGVARDRAAKARRQQD